MAGLPDQGGEGAPRSHRRARGVPVESLQAALLPVGGAPRRQGTVRPTGLLSWPSSENPYSRETSRPAFPHLAGYAQRGGVNCRYPGV